MRARPCPTSVRIRESSYSSSLDHAVQKSPVSGAIDALALTVMMKRFRTSVLAFDIGEPPPLAAVFLGLRRPFRLGLRVADGLGQHLAKLGLGLWRFARETLCPCSHVGYMGTLQSVLNPRLELTRLRPKSRFTSVLRPLMSAQVPRFLRARLGTRQHWFSRRN